jgi:hypothetical protein
MKLKLKMVMVDVKMKNNFFPTNLIHPKEGETPKMPTGM